MHSVCINDELSGYKKIFGVDSLLFYRSLVQLAITFGFFLGSGASALTPDRVFNSGVIESRALQQQIIEEILAEFPCIESLRERETMARSVIIDNGIEDIFYETRFSAEGYFDKYHLSHIFIDVSSARYSGQNPSVPWFEVLFVNAQFDTFCE